MKYKNSKFGGRDIRNLRVDVVTQKYFSIATYFFFCPGAIMKPLFPPETIPALRNFQEKLTVCCTFKNKRNCVLLSSCILVLQGGWDYLYSCFE